MTGISRPSSTGAPAPTDRDAVRKRLLSVSRVNGWLVLTFAAISLLLSLSNGDRSGIAICVAVLVSPLMELTGHYRLKAGEATAARLLPGSQLWLLVSVLIYSVIQLSTIDQRTALAGLSAETLAALTGLVADEAELGALAVLVRRTTYLAVILVTVLYQGGLYLYYRSRTRRLLPG